MVKNIDFNASIHNRFDIELKDAKTGEIKQKAVAYNVICDAVWSIILSGSAYFNYICFGSGTGTPASTDTGLFTYIGCVSLGSNDHTYKIDRINGVLSNTASITLSDTQYNNYTFREVGIGYAYGDGNLSSHAMLQDMNGNPISILKTNTDILTIYATVYVHYDPLGYNNVFIADTSLASNDTYGFLRWISGTGGTISNYTVGAVCADNVSSSYGTVTKTYNISNKSMTFTMQRLPVGSANGKGFSYVVLTMSGNGSTRSGHEVVYVDTKAFGGFNVLNESVGTGDSTTTEFKTKFNFPRNATVYLNGAAVTSGVQVLKTNVDGDPTAYLNRIIYSSSTAQHPMLMPVLGSPNTIRETSTSAGLIRIGLDYGTNSTYYYWNNQHCPIIGTMSGSSQNYMTIYGSDNLSDWTLIKSSTSSGTFSITYEFYKLVTGGAVQSFTKLPTNSGNNIIFDTPPANGDIITISYTTDVVPKDENHVFDMSVTITLGEYNQQH